MKLSTFIKQFKYGATKITTAKNMLRAAKASAILAATTLGSSLSAQTVTISSPTGLPTGPKVIISQPVQTQNCCVSIRYLPNDVNRELKYDSVVQQHYFIRDRDLGQVFKTGSTVGELDAITVRVSPGSGAVGSGAAGSKVFMQIFSVSGNEAINNAGTTGSQTTKWGTYNPSVSISDDYLTGLTFTSLEVFTGGTLPSNLSANQYLRFNLTPNSIILQPNTRYAFLIGFEQPAPGRSFTLASLGRAFDSSLSDPYLDGFGIRRDGNTPPVSIPGNVISTDVFIANTADSSDVQKARTAASFSPANRFAKSPGTIGLPDVDTYRDFVFAIQIQ